MNRLCILALAISMMELAAAAPAVACDAAGPNSHVGVVTAVDRARSTLTLTDAETGRPLTFLAQPDLIRGIAPKDEVVVKFTPDGRTLRATSVEKAGN